VYVFPAKVVADGLHYFFPANFPIAQAIIYRSIISPKARQKELAVKTVGEYIEAQSWLERYEMLGIEPVMG
jgi:hypothetical protein